MPENMTKLEIPIYRTGDLSQEMMVICYTRQGKDQSVTNVLVSQLEIPISHFSRDTDLLVCLYSCKQAVAKIRAHLCGP